MIDDVFRNAGRDLATIDQATAAHLAQISELASRRKVIITGLVLLARANGVKAPQQYVADRLGISQQTVSKIINRRD